MFYNVNILLIDRIYPARSLEKVKVKTTLEAIHVYH